MATECYALVRGSSIRVTSLDRRGRLGDESIQYGVSKSVARVAINEVAEDSASETLTNDVSQGEERRLHLVRSGQTVRFTADIAFLRMDPGLISLMTGMPMVENAAGDIVGIDGRSRLPAQAFALEVWSNLAGRACEGGQQWGYTLFPFLKGGILTGFTFSQGLVSFTLERAATQRNPNWGTGPFGVDMPTGVSRNTAWRTTLVSTAPPTQTDGIAVLDTDDLDGGTATITTSDVVDGQFVTTSASIVDGGAA